MDWVRQNPAIATALIAASSALLGGLIAAIAKFVFDFYLFVSKQVAWHQIKIYQA
jgi:hypothetical protein